LNISTIQSPGQRKSLLAADDFLESFQISVETRQGAVQLSGFVNSKSTDKAGEIARSIKGAKSIENNLVVKQGSSWWE